MSTKNVSKNGLVLSRTNFVTLSNVNNSIEALWKAFGAWYQKQREQAGKTQEDVAKAAAIHVKTVSRIENGEGTKRKTVIALASAIEADVNEALKKAGFAPQNTENNIPKPIKEALSTSGNLDDGDMQLIANFIRMLSEQKKNGE
jgi:transcriptional regulator with XRE-family HTH domain